MTQPFPSSSATPMQNPRASFGIRFVALLIDVILLAIVQRIFGLVIDPPLITVIGLLLGLVYWLYLEGSPSGQTIGKKVMNIRVIDAATGGPLGYGRAALRYVGRIASSIPCALGYFWMLWDKDKQTWHDKIATTVVVPTSDYPVSAWPG